MSCASPYEQSTHAHPTHPDTGKALCRLCPRATPPNRKVPRVNPSTSPQAHLAAVALSLSPALFPKASLRV